MQLDAPCSSHSIFRAPRGLHSQCSACTGYSLSYSPPPPRSGRSCTSCSLSKRRRLMRWLPARERACGFGVLWLVAGKAVRFREGSSGSTGARRRHACAALLGAHTGRPASRVQQRPGPPPARSHPFSAAVQTP